MRDMKYKAIYPNIERYIDKHYKSRQTFAELNGLDGCSLNRILSGRTMPNKKTIDKILKGTGMIYEEAFKTDQEH